MSKAFVFLPEGFEETEAVTTIDLLRRGGVKVRTVSLTSSLWVTGSHQVKIEADVLFEEAEADDNADMLVLPGGPGTENYKSHDKLLAMIKRYDSQRKVLAAICAAPTVLGLLGLLRGRAAVCYPGLEGALGCATLSDQPVVVDGHIVTAKGPGASMAFGFQLVAVLMGDDTAENVKSAFLSS